MKRFGSWASTLLILLCAAHGKADPSDANAFSLPLYPNARETLAPNFRREPGKIVTTTERRTRDSVEKVAAFYRSAVKKKRPSRAAEERQDEGVLTIWNNEEENGERLQIETDAGETRIRYTRTSYVPGKAPAIAPTASPGPSPFSIATYGNAKPIGPVSEERWPGERETVQVCVSPDGFERVVTHFRQVMSRSAGFSERVTATEVRFTITAPSGDERVTVRKTGKETEIVHRRRVHVAE